MADWKYIRKEYIFQLKFEQKNPNLDTKICIGLDFSYALI